ncbi:MAG: hypothetical protein HYW93_07580 [Thaumarchaeota archaeon]|nr:hypothetical protein [Nitrososphaerota archaeon]
MRVGILHSGGKDSTYAAWIASKRDEPVCLITLLPRRENSDFLPHSCQPEEMTQDFF